jgi:hypothetical protein
LYGSIQVRDFAEAALSHPPLITRAVETVEKVHFQKLIVWKWEKNIEKRHVFVF